MWFDKIKKIEEKGLKVKKRVSVVLLFNNGKILAVSRKDNPNDFGLPGGKADDGETFHDAAVREVKEETGLDIFGLIPIFKRKDGDFWAMCYIAQYKGEIDNSLESGVVKWADFEEINAGSFGKYNSALQEYLKEVGFLR